MCLSEVSLPLLQSYAGLVFCVTRTHTLCLTLSFPYMLMYKHTLLALTHTCPFEAAEPITLFINKPWWHHSKMVANQSTRNGFQCTSHVCCVMTARQHPAPSGTPSFLTFIYSRNIFWALFSTALLHRHTMEMPNKKQTPVFGCWLPVTAPNITTKVFNLNMLLYCTPIFSTTLIYPTWMN